MRLLIVEPFKLLQHAFASALFSEHEVEILQRVPQTTPDADLVVIDAVSLRERAWLSASELGMIQRWQAPVIWIDSDEAERPQRAGITTAQWPLDKEFLRQSLLGLRASAGLSERKEEQPRAEDRVRTPPKLASPKPNGPVAFNHNVIDLVEVVEETAVAESAHSTRSSKKE